MKIAFLSETKLNGKYPENFSNSRTDVAWQTALGATHYCITDQKFLGKEIDIAIVILPKNSNTLQKIDSTMFDYFQQSGTKVGVMQEGPNWYFQDYSAEDNLLYYKYLLQADFILCHNEVDHVYFKGLVGHNNVHIMPSTMRDPGIKSIMQIERKEEVMIGGGFTSWYGGFDSFVVAQRAEITPVMPSMGRRQENEELWGINHLPYMDWTQWIMELNHYKYAIHLMRTFAAGTFAMNCAALGVPCIGYKDLDTQRNLHPALSIDIGDLGKAAKLLKQLKTDKGFYDECSRLAKVNFINSNYNEPNYRNYMTRLFYEILEEEDGTI